MSRKLPKVTVLLVPADPNRSARTVRDVEQELPVLRKLIGGGYLENVTTGSGTWHAYCDEEGKLKNLPVNTRATRLAMLCGWRVGDWLCGDVVFLGYGPNGQEADVPPLVTGQAAQMMDVV